MAESVTSLRRTRLVAIGGKADIGRSCCLLWSDANDPIWDIGRQICCDATTAVR